LQDLYRFFKLNTHRNEYIDVFALGFDVLDSEVLKIVFENNKIIRNLAEFYFAKDQYTDAIRLFGWLNDQDKSFELLEKIGFCYQKSGNYRQAILSYNQAELFDRNKLWLQKKLGYCYRKIGDYGKAIEQYNLVIKAEPNNLSNLAYIGQLHIDCEDYDEALKYYYKVEYENPKNPKIYRPIGWCSFLLGKYDTAIKYFKKVINDKPNQSDFLNIGHCYWAAGKTGEALEAYRSALFKSKNDEKWFRESFRKDQNYLIAKSIHEFDIALMIDYVLLK
jgi:tetratricopeptide (TPR) repeat protein